MYICVEQNIWLELLTWSFPVETTFLFKDGLSNTNFCIRITFQIQIFGTIDDLSDYLGIHFQAVGITVVPSDDYIMPLVVIQGAVTVAFDHIGTITKIKHIVYIPMRRGGKHNHFRYHEVVQWQSHIYPKQGVSNLPG